MGKSEDLERTARFFTVREFAEKIPKPQKMHPHYPCVIVMLWNLEYTFSLEI
jgi:hypothetical protein